MKDKVFSVILSGKCDIGKTYSIYDSEIDTNSIQQVKRNVFRYITYNIPYYLNEKGIEFDEFLDSRIEISDTSDKNIKSYIFTYESTGNNLIYFLRRRIHRESSEFERHKNVVSLVNKDFRYIDNPISITIIGKTEKDIDKLIFFSEKKRKTGYKLEAKFRDKDTKLTFRAITTQRNFKEVKNQIWIDDMEDRNYEYKKRKKWNYETSSTEIIVDKKRSKIKTTRKITCIHGVLGKTTLHEFDEDFYLDKEFTNKSIEIDFETQHFLLKSWLEGICREGVLTLLQNSESYNYIDEKGDYQGLNFGFNYELFFNLFTAINKFLPNLARDFVKGFYLDVFVEIGNYDLGVKWFKDRYRVLSNKFNRQNRYIVTPELDILSIYALDKDNISEDTFEKWEFTLPFNWKYSDLK